MSHCHQSINHQSIKTSLSGCAVSHRGLGDEHFPSTTCCLLRSCSWKWEIIILYY